MMLSPGIKPGPHSWEASALTTAPLELNLAVIQCVFGIKLRSLHALTVPEHLRFMPNLHSYTNSFAVKSSSTCSLVQMDTNLATVATVSVQCDSFTGPFFATVAVHPNWISSGTMGMELWPTLYFQGLYSAWKSCKLKLWNFNIVYSRPGNPGHTVQPVEQQRSNPEVMGSISHDSQCFFSLLLAISLMLSGKFLGSHSTTAHTVELILLSISFNLVHQALCVLHAWFVWYKYNQLVSKINYNFSVIRNLSKGTSF